MSPILNRRRQTLKLVAMLAVFCFSFLPFTATSAEHPLKSTHSYIANLGNRSPELDVYRSRTSRNAPVLLYVHGGAWAAGSKSAVHNMPAHFARLGFVFVSVDYRLVPDVGVQDQLGDIDSALGWVAQNIARFGGNPSNLHLIGHSAGAHLVTMSAVAPKPTTKRLIKQGALRSVISNDTRAYDIPRIAAGARGGKLPRLYARVFGQDPTFWKTMSPIHNLTTHQTYPAFLLLYSGTGDGAVRQSFAQDFAANLQKSGRQTSLFDGRHYSHREMNRDIGTAADLTQAIDGFLARHQ